MIVVKLSGGLGNQMFQYAYGLYLSVKYSYPICLDKSIYKSNRSNRPFALDVFNLGDCRPFDIDTVDVELFKNKDLFLLEEQHFHFSPLALEPLDEADDKTNCILVISGYWQSEKYFSSVQGLLRKHFCFNQNVTGVWEEMRRHILSVNSVMINVRRGDYMGLMHYHGVIGVEYIQRGIDFFSSQIKNIIVFVFSDDMDWCRQHIKVSYKTVFVDERYYDNKFALYMQLMISCKYFIISNSSFSWRAAWLASYKEKKVVAPERWFVTQDLDVSDLIPDNWIKI